MLGFLIGREASGRIRLVLLGVYANHGILSRLPMRARPLMTPARLWGMIDARSPPVSRAKVI